MLVPIIAEHAARDAVELAPDLFQRIGGIVGNSFRQSGESFGAGFRPAVLVEAVDSTVEAVQMRVPHCEKQVLGEHEAERSGPFLALMRHHGHADADFAILDGKPAGRFDLFQVGTRGYAHVPVRLHPFDFLRSRIEQIDPDRATVRVGADIQHGLAGGIRAGTLL